VSERLVLGGGSEHALAGKSREGLLVAGEVLSLVDGAAGE
jgi:hypothetical protein